MMLESLIPVFSSHRGSSPSGAIDPTHPAPDVPLANTRPEGQPDADIVRTRQIKKLVKQLWKQFTHAFLHQ